MKAVNHRKPISGISPLLVVITILIISYTCPSLEAQNDVGFTPTDDFAIPASNGTITFAFNGTYTEARLVNDTWTFINLRLNYSQPLAKLEVTAQNSNVTIISYFIFNSRLNTTFTGALLGYRVEGQGKQTFNIGLPLTEGEWSVLLGDDFMGEGDGWQVSPDQTLTITDAESDVTLWYFGVPEDFTADDSNDPFYLQHSVAIGTAAALVVISSIALTIRRKNKTPSRKLAGEKQI